MIDLPLQKHAFLALGAAVLFGVSTPLAKLLLGVVTAVSPMQAGIGPRVLVGTVLR
jgi:hypothetical protein